MTRVQDPTHGDQLVFGSEELAADFSLRQADRWYRYWASRENLATSQLSQMLTRHVLTSDHPLAKPYQTHFPGDTLRGLESEWQATLLQMSENDPAISGILKIMQPLAEHARHHNSEERDIWTPYQGSNFPEWAMMQNAGQRFADTTPSFSRGRLGSYLVLRSNPGKERLVNAFVGRVGSLARIYDVRPDVKELIDQSAQWALEGFTLTIMLNDRRLGLTPKEVEAIRKMTLPAVAKKWQQALQRPEMSPEELAAHIERANATYRSVGRLSVEPVANLAA